MAWGDETQNLGNPKIQDHPKHMHHQCAQKAATYIFFIQVPQENAVVFASTHHPFAFGICSDECRKQAEVLIDMPCTSCMMLSVVAASREGYLILACTGETANDGA